MATFLNNVTASETFLEGCPDPTAGRAIVVPSIMGAVAPELQHQLRGPDGAPIDLTSIDPNGEGNSLELIPGGKVSTVYLADALRPDCTDRATAVAIEIVDAVNGIIAFNLPAKMASNPGIYMAEFIIADLQGRPYIHDSTLISVERSLTMTSPLVSGGGPLTLGEVRMHLRDYPGLNTAYQQAEFSDAEIVHCLLLPLREFNEMPPRILFFGAHNFPWRLKWLEGTTACLLKMAANWYMRNSQKLVYGDGKTSDDRDKMATYLNVAEAAWQQYRRFCEHEQTMANYRTGVGMTGGTYV